MARSSPGFTLVEQLTLYVFAPAVHVLPLSPGHEGKAEVEGEIELENDAVEVLDPVTEVAEEAGLLLLPDKVPLLEEFVAGLVLIPLVDDSGGLICMKASAKLSRPELPVGPKVNFSQHVVLWPGFVF